MIPLIFPKVPQSSLGFPRNTPPHWVGWTNGWTEVILRADQLHHKHQSNRGDETVVFLLTGFLCSPVRSMYLGGGNSNIVDFHPDPWGNDPI